MAGDQGFIHRCGSGIILVVANVPGSNFDVAFAMEACVATVLFVLCFCVPDGGVPYLLAATTDGGPDTEPGATEELLASSPHFSPDEQETLRLLVGTGELAAVSPAAVHHRGVHGGREDGAARRPRPRAGPHPPR